jgi:hypothetical protein
MKKDPLLSFKVAQGFSDNTELLATIANLLAA